MTPDEPIAQKNIITRGLPKTGQTIEYRVGDDGTYAAGWWLGRLNANNRTRFVDKTLSGDDVVVDRATGLMWPKSGSSVACNNGNTINWNGAIDFALAVDFAGFTNWRIPNIRELVSIGNHELFNPAIWPIFTNVQGAPEYRHWSSTTYFQDTAKAWAGVFSHGGQGADTKTDLRHIRSVRRFA